MKKQRIILILVLSTVLIIAGLVLLNIFYPGIFQNFEWYGKVLMALLITVILIVAVKSYGSVTGTYLSYKFQVSGGIVIFALVFASSFTREIFFQNQDFNFSVQIENYNEKVMPKNIEIFFLDGTYRPTAKFDDLGIATFLNIPNRLKEKEVKFQLAKSDDYTITENAQAQILDNQKTIVITLHRDDHLLGRVFDRSMKALDSVAVSFEGIDTTIFTNIDGHFDLRVREENKRPVYRLVARKGSSSTSGEVSLNASSDFMLDNN